MLPENSDRFTSSFPIWIPVIYYSCLIGVSRSSDTVLSKNGKNRHPCLIPYFRREVFVFSLLIMLFVMG